MRTGGTIPITLLLGACALLAGCADPLAGRTAGFAAAAAPALTDVRDGYALVQQMHGSAIIAKNVVAYQSTSIDNLRGSLDFGAPEDLQVRAQVLTLLSGYIAQLASVSGQPKPADEPAKAAGAAAGKDAETTLTAPGDVKPPKLSNSALQQAASAIQTLEGLLVERARRRALPRILAQADGPVGAICTAMRRDFGAPDTPGLRSQVRADYELRITLADAAIRDHASAYSYPEHEHAIESLFALMREEQQADAALAQTEQTLAQFAATHHALLQSAGHGDDAAFKTQLGRLTLEAKELGVMEHQLDAAQTLPVSPLPGPQKETP